MSHSELCLPLKFPASSGLEIIPHQWNYLFIYSLFHSYHQNAEDACKNIYLPTWLFGLTLCGFMLKSLTLYLAFTQPRPHILPALFSLKKKQPKNIYYSQMHVFVISQNISVKAALSSRFVGGLYRYLILCYSLIIDCM